MNFNQAIHEEFNLLLRRIQAKDSQATGRLASPAVRLINNTPFQQPVADVQITVKGVNHNYSITRDRISGRLESMPFVNVSGQS